MTKLEFSADAAEAHTRLDALLAKRCPQLTRAQAQQLLSEGCVLCNGKSAAKSYRVAAGDCVAVEVPDAQPVEVEPQNIPA